MITFHNPPALIDRCPDQPNYAIKQRLKIKNCSGRLTNNVKQATL